MNECLFIIRTVYGTSCFPHAGTFSSSTWYSVMNIRPSTHSYTHCLSCWQRHYINHRQVGINQKITYSGPTGRRLDPSEEKITINSALMDATHEKPSTQHIEPRAADQRFMSFGELSGFKILLQLPWFSYYTSFCTLVQQYATLIQLYSRMLFQVTPYLLT